MKLVRVLRVALLEALAGIREREFLFWCILFPLMWVLLTAYVFVPPSQPIPTFKVALIEAPGNEFPVKVLREAMERVNGTTAKLILVNEAEASGDRASRLAEELLLSRKAHIAFVASSPPPPWINSSSRAGNWTWRGWKVKAYYLSTGSGYEDAMLAATARSILGAADALARAFIANISSYYAAKYFEKYAPPEYRNMSRMIAGECG